MSKPSAGLLDTSVFIAGEDERPLGDLPDRVAVSVVTIGELQLQDSDYEKIAGAHPALHVLQV